MLPSDASFGNYLLYIHSKISEGMTENILLINREVNLYRTSILNSSPT